MTAPPEGPLFGRWGPYIRNPQPLGNGLFLCEGQKSLRGTGRVWRPTLVRPHPQAGQPKTTMVVPDWQQVGYVQAARGYRKGQWHTVLYRSSLYIEGFFPTQERALRFLLHNAATTFLED